MLFVIGLFRKHLLHSVLKDFVLQKLSDLLVSLVIIKQLRRVYQSIQQALHCLVAFALLHVGLILLGHC